MLPPESRDQSEHVATTVVRAEMRDTTAVLASARVGDLLRTFSLTGMKRPALNGREGSGKPETRSATHREDLDHRGGGVRPF